MKRVFLLPLPAAQNLSRGPVSLRRPVPRLLVQSGPAPSLPLSRGARPSSPTSGRTRTLPESGWSARRSSVARTPRPPARPYLSSAGPVLDPPPRPAAASRKTLAARAAIWSPKAWCRRRSAVPPLLLDKFTAQEFRKVARELSDPFSPSLSLSSVRASSPEPCAAARPAPATAALRRPLHRVRDVAR